MTFADLLYSSVMAVIDGVDPPKAKAAVLSAPAPPNILLAVANVAEFLQEVPLYDLVALVKGEEEIVAF